MPMPIMTGTNSNNGMMLIKQLTGSDAGVVPNQCAW